MKYYIIVIAVVWDEVYIAIEQFETLELAEQTKSEFLDKFYKTYAETSGKIKQCSVFSSTDYNQYQGGTTQLNDILNIWL